MADLFGQVLGLCARAGLVSVGTIALDGTRVVANAADRANRSYDQLATEILEEAARVDEAEDAEFGDARGDELPPALADPRPARSACARPGAASTRSTRPSWPRWPPGGRRRPNTPPAPATGRRAPRPSRARSAERGGSNQHPDPDSRPVKTARGFIQGYTAQAVATEDQVVVAADVITGGNERHRLGPIAAAAERELKGTDITERPEVALADAGYWNGEQIEALEAKGIEVLLPPDADTRKAPSKIRRGGRYQRMRERLARPEAAVLYRRRQQMIEPVFAQIKNNLRAGRFQRRGLANCRAEWRLITATHNLLKPYRSGLAPAGV